MAGITPSETRMDDFNAANAGRASCAATTRAASSSYDTISACTSRCAARPRRRAVLAGADARWPGADPNAPHLALAWSHGQRGHWPADPRACAWRWTPPRVVHLNACCLRRVSEANWRWPDVRGVPTVRGAQGNAVYGSFNAARAWSGGTVTRPVPAAPAGTRRPEPGEGWTTAG